MQTFTRVDGVQCEAMRFTGGGVDAADHLFEVLDILNKAELQAVWVEEEKTDEWVENEEGDDYVQVVVPEHIKTINDELWVGDAILRRDGDTYIMDGHIFEAIWTAAITNAIGEWEWVLDKALPYESKKGFWQNKYNPDVVSTDGGITHFPPVGTSSLPASWSYL